MVTAARPETAAQPLTDWPPVPSQALLARRDLANGLVRYWMWWNLALQDIKLRYRGSTLGPFWLTLSTLLLVVGMGTIYSRLFHTDAFTYMPYLTMGLIIWQYISTLTIEGCQTFLLTEGVIQQVPIPYSIHGYRVVCRNFVVLGHNLLIVPFGLVIFGIPIGWSIVEIVPAILMLAINGIWVSLMLGLLSARFRDIAPIVSSFLQMAFFLTPVIWQPEALGPHRWIADFNPIFAAIDVIRAPLLAVAPAPTSWPILLAFTAAGCGVTFVLYVRFRNRIAYWV